MYMHHQLEKGIDIIAILKKNINIYLHATLKSRKHPSRKDVCQLRSAMADDDDEWRSVCFFSFRPAHFITALCRFLTYTGNWILGGWTYIHINRPLALPILSPTMLLETLRAQSRIRQAILLAGAGSAAYYAYKRVVAGNRTNKEEEELKKRYVTPCCFSSTYCLYKRKCGHILPLVHRGSDHLFGLPHNIHCC
jgi:hypothetical protein